MCSKESWSSYCCTCCTDEPPAKGDYPPPIPMVTRQPTPTPAPERVPPPPHSEGQPSQELPLVSQSSPRPSSSNALGVLQDPPTDSPQTTPTLDQPTPSPVVDKPLESTSTIKPSAGAGLATGPGGPAFFSNANYVQLNGDLNYTEVHGKAVAANDSTVNAGWQVLVANTAENALCDSSNRRDLSKPDLSARDPIVKECITWIHTQDTTRILCITGTEGVGKTDIQQALADECEDLKIPSSSFFFSSSDPTRNSLSNVVPTLAYQLGHRNPALKRTIATVVHNDPLIFKKTVRQQLDALVVVPALLHLAQNGSVTPVEGKGAEEFYPYAILLDCLDQCHGEARQHDLVLAIKHCILERETPFRVVITSKPDAAIRHYLLYGSSAHHIDLNARLAKPGSSSRTGSLPSEVATESPGPSAQSSPIRRWTHLSDGGSSSNMGDPRSIESLRSTPQALTESPWSHMSNVTFESVDELVTATPGSSRSSKLADWIRLSDTGFKAPAPVEGSDSPGPSSPKSVPGGLALSLNVGPTIVEEPESTPGEALMPMELSQRTPGPQGESMDSIMKAVLDAMQSSAVT
ncbi:hypothetical protein DFP72DRAFT_1018446 [Ephemerocybe angulata]|uniref:Nephrocystin 3-like N-terminal domain-containing protein n=1 Tax=Ephemerocybe angulata TaxID=980116 RepID=A0A8H6HEK4_9AGAR|nr:hypothetical protein DFP72DRAFT_1018446 [Tulosesus angulatus]